MTPDRRLLLAFALIAAPHLAQAQEPKIAILNIPKPANPEPRLTVPGEAPVQAFGIAHLAAFASQFAQPALRSDEEIRTLGDQTIVALVRPKQEAWLRDLIQNQLASASADTRRAVPLRDDDSQSVRTTRRPALR